MDMDHTYTNNKCKTVRLSIIFSIVNLAECCLMSILQACIQRLPILKTYLEEHLSLIVWLFKTSFTYQMHMWDFKV